LKRCFSWRKGRIVIYRDGADWEVRDAGIGREVNGKRSEIMREIESLRR
jgi:hypothetical protein